MTNYWGRRGKSLRMPKKGVSDMGCSKGGGVGEERGRVGKGPSLLYQKPRKVMPNKILGEKE